MKKLLIVMSLFTIIGKVSAQDKNFQFSGFLEVYYSYDFNKPADHNKEGFIYSHNRHNELNLNLGFVKGSLASDRVRGNFALMTGSYSNANLSGEPGVLKNIYEANAGVKLAAKKNLWIDAGIFASHLGFESAHSPSCWNLTRSIIADNSPYYESGIKLNYDSDNGKWTFASMYLNGWQRITRIDGNSTPAFGTQVTYKPNNKVLLNYSTFIGNDKPDSVRLMRYFNNFYGILQLTSKFGLIAGVDYGLEQKTKGSSDMNNWFGGALIAKYVFNDKVALAARYEYYQDENEVIITTEAPDGFKASGYSLNFDYAPIKNALFRIEGKLLNSKNAVFTKENSLVNNDAFITTSLSISF
ncbi:porin [Solitalea lacus]|uniref:porin n=1 Tax=Solitalea lacus TaxID=2911172 RepID=UPI001EDBC2A4|nr:porin [Solitalea lacus]UKJ07752.1 porin [Solitalea lacus]